MHTLDSLLDDPHLQAVGFLRTVDHPSEGRIQSMAVPSTWSRSVPTVMRQAPRLGEHSAQILQEAGYSAEQITALATSGVTVLASPPTSDNASDNAGG